MSYSVWSQVCITQSPPTGAQNHDVLVMETEIPETDIQRESLSPGDWRRGEVNLFFQASSLFKMDSDSVEVLNPDGYRPAIVQDQPAQMDSFWRNKTYELNFISLSGL